jgi:hypothetical protein
LLANVVQQVWARKGPHDLKELTLNAVYARLSPHLEEDGCRGFILNSREVVIGAVALEQLDSYYSG